MTSGAPSQPSPSGAQWTVRRGHEELVVVEVGGGIRTYTTGRRRAPHELTNGIAVEPMTCPPDAYNSGEDLLVLEPGQSNAGTWGIRTKATRGG